MPKLQRIVRKNGTDVYTLVIPKEEVEIAQLKRGDELDITANGKGQLTIVLMNRGL